MRRKEGIGNRKQEERKEPGSLKRKLKSVSGRKSERRKGK